MSSHGASTYRYGAINRQMQRVSKEHERNLRRAWTDRVLEILDGDNLITQAASGQASGDALLFECNVAPLVWDDPRIVYRLQQLERTDITVELVDYEHTIAGRTFKRTRIKVTFAT